MRCVPASEPRGGLFTPHAALRMRRSEYSRRRFTHRVLRLSRLAYDDAGRRTRVLGASRPFARLEDRRRRERGDVGGLDTLVLAGEAAACSTLVLRTAAPATPERLRPRRTALSTVMH